METVDPATGQTIYRDETTGEVVSPDEAFGPANPVAQAGTQVAERTVTQQDSPATGEVVTQRTVSGPAGPAMHTQESEVYTEDPYAHRRERTLRVQQAIYLIFGIIEGLLAIRFVLHLLGANPQSGFASFIYSITAPFMAPFANVFTQPSIAGSVVEFNAIVAIVVYALLAWVLAKIVWLVAGESRSGTRTSQVHTRIDR